MAVSHSVKVTLNSIPLLKTGASLDIYSEDRSGKTKLGTLIISPGCLRWKIGNRKPIRVLWENLAARLIGR